MITALAKSGVIGITKKKKPPKHGTEGRVNDMRLIDADALKIENVDLEHGCTVVDYALAVIKSVAEAPTIDAVPVVRCKYCKYCSPYLEECGATTLYCRKHYSIAELVIPYDFCAYGERKDGGA